MHDPDPGDHGSTLRFGPAGLVVEAPGGAMLRVDAEGRWGSFRPEEALHRRTLDGKVVVHEGRALRVLDEAGGAGVHERAVALAIRLAQDLAAPGGADHVVLHGEGAAVGEAVAWLERAAAWTAERYRAEAERFHAAYPEPVFILPPDRYHDVVVLPAVGCPHGRCRFCAFYRERGFRILGEEEFSAHLEAVARLFGRAATARGGVFLGSASALSLPQARLLEVLHAVEARFGASRRGLAAFLDPDHAPARSVDDGVALREAGLRVVTVGLETGWPELREALGKRGDLSGVRSAVGMLKQAGLDCGVTVLVGAGGAAAAADHERATVEVIAGLPFTRRDLVYLSPLSSPAGSSEGGSAFSEADQWRQFGRLREALTLRTEARVVPYRIERYHYFA